MRNLLATTEDVPTWCNKSNDYSYPFKQIAASYGFPARSWQQNALSTALEPSCVLTLPMNAAASELPSDTELPMNKSIATNLAAYALLVSNNFLGWWGEDDVAWGHDWYLYYKDRTDSFAMADHLNLTEHFSGEVSFLANVHEVVADYFRKTANASTTNDLAKVEFAHVDLSDTMVFDALTIEISTQKTGKQANNSSDFYESLNSVLCNHDACLLNDLGEFIANGASTTIYPRVQALAICLNEAGGEDLVVDFNYWRANEVFQACERRSNTSMIIVSIGKRLEGDAFERRPANTNPGVSIAGQLKNARMVYFLTVGRLSWTPEDLSDVFSAECLVESGCYGIQFPLDNGENTSRAEVLVSSARGVPINLLNPINLNELFFQHSVSISQWKILVSTVDETRGAELVAETRPAVAVLPRNFETVDTSFTAYMEEEGWKFCELFIDKHLTHVEKTIYTLSARFSQLLLRKFPWNFRETFKISVAGCVVVLVCSISIGKLAKKGDGLLLDHGAASTAAEAMGNQDKFPHFLLHVQLREEAARGLPEPVLDSLRVKSMVLVNRSGETQQFNL
ncbi:hypothetical protein PHYSODRAFT_307457 [Phytophthora sojae]|uniref:Uncharacterized protein n=1 Tax=Phytophthora sojae (strain P6497) TaxID=1094619 RepID=G5AEP0_PHYSP|nr:hypothetical protein PHYSODRAFT_307457 [Phytophthora sojae]EGZ05680.1 hypothetical protein PHYSODRAFT_307457 [Phytophthora sojae]|eukprot:XP_009538541.1 hypothetical protein PHYSODRAFT_307457 [Phytophthora sojae]